MNGLLRQVEADLAAVGREATAIIQAAEARGSGFTDEEREKLTELRDRKEALKADRELVEASRQDRIEQPTFQSVIPSAADSDEEREEKEQLAPTPFRSLGEQLRAVATAAMTGRIDPRLDQIQKHAAASGANETVPSEGGFLVQKDFSNELLTEVHETGVLSSRARRVPVSGNGLKMNAVDERSRATGSRWGGIQAYWLAEAETKLGSKPKFRQIDMSLQKLVGLLYATDELLQDTSALESVARQGFAEEFGFQVDDAMIRGTGAGVPLGILNAPALVTVAKEAAQAADTIVAANLYKMFSRVPARSLTRAQWHINQAVWPQLFTLQDANGNNLYLPAGRISDSPFGTLLGLPVVPIEQASALGDVGDIILADWQQYLLIEKAGGIQSASSIHVKFETDETTFRWVLRTNGQPIPVSAITPYKGADTLSPFVTLAERA